MQYSELVKKFERIRRYMREFYIYGFRTREQFYGKSGRSYDDERRRLESVLGEFTASRRDSSGKNVYLSIDSRSGGSNPLYRLFRTCSFTDRDITLHFLLLDLLCEEQPLSLGEIVERLQDYTADFHQPLLPDESGVRKKLAEYEALGLVRTEKQGRAVRYYKAASPDLAGFGDALDFFTEAAPCGVIGSFITDKRDTGVFRFKHHYISDALDSEVLCTLLEAISDQREAELLYSSPKSGVERRWTVVPLKIFASVQSGRQWVMAYNPVLHEILPYRLDRICGVKPGGASPRFGELRAALDEMRGDMWGVSADKRKRPGMVQFIIHIGEGEEHIWRRLLREKHHGTAERLDKSTARFTVRVKDPSEILPWIRTFTGRIVQLDFTDRTMENKLRNDMQEMYELYGIGGDENAVP
ncbi:MAG: WYL domain-containing protein [Oscillospiraceae bacterium]